DRDRRTAIAFVEITEDDRRQRGIQVRQDPSDFIAANRSGGEISEHFAPTVRRGRPQMDVEELNLAQRRLHLHELTREPASYGGWEPFFIAQWNPGKSARRAVRSDR